jgi:cytochrome c556
MKIRTLLFALACSLAVSPAVRAADTETELGGKMEKMGSSFRVIKRQIGDATKNADTLAKLAVLKENAEASLKLEPAMKADKPKGDQGKFVADYQAGMKKFIELCGKLEAALKKGDNAEATKICGAMGDAQKAGHKDFKKPDEKKKKA